MIKSRVGGCLDTREGIEKEQMQQVSRIEITRIE